MKKYLYRGEQYTTERDLRQAIFEQTRVAIRPIIEDSEWEKYGVKVEQVVQEQPKQSFEVVKHQKMFELESRFEHLSTSKTSSVMSELGFEVNCNLDSYQRILMIEDQMLEDDVVMFRIFDNTYQELTKKDLAIIKKEIAKFHSELCHAKWEAKELIEAAETVEQLETVEIAL